MHKIELLGYRIGGIRGNICALSKMFEKRNLAAEFHRENVSFTRKTAIE